MKRPRIQSNRSNQFSNPVKVFSTDKFSNTGFKNQDNSAERMFRNPELAKRDNKLN